MPQLRRRRREDRRSSTRLDCRAAAGCAERASRLARIAGRANSLTVARPFRPASRARAAPYDRPHGARLVAFALFATAIGDCAIAWNEVGLTGVWLPEAARDSLRAQGRAAAAGGARERARRPRRRSRSRRSRACCAASASTSSDDRASTTRGIDAFDRRVYAVARTIAPGRVAHLRRARAPASAPTRRPARSASRSAATRFRSSCRAIAIVAAGGELGGFSAPGGTATKRRLLTIEDARRRRRRRPLRSPPTPAAAPRTRVAQRRPSGASGGIATVAACLARPAR